LRRTSVLREACCHLTDRDSFYQIHGR